MAKFENEPLKNVAFAQQLILLWGQPVCATGLTIICRNWLLISFFQAFARWPVWSERFNILGLDMSFGART